MNPWEEDYSKPSDKKPWEEDYSAPPAKEPGYLQTVAQPMIDAEAKLHARNDAFNALPLGQKPARFVNDLAGGLGDVVTGLAGSAVNLIPQKAQAAIGDVIERPVQALGQGLSSAIPEPVKQLGSDVASGWQGFEKEHPIAAEYAKAIPNAAMLAVPEAKGLQEVGKGAGGGLQSVGTGLENLGKTTLKGEMKITNPIAREAYGSTLADKKAGIIDDLVRFKLDSPTGNFQKMGEKAQGMASGNFQKADQLIKDASEDTNAPLNNPVDIARESIKNIPVAAGFEDQAINTAQRVINGLQRRGYDDMLTPDKLVEAKKILNADGNVFKNGPMATDADNLDRTIRKQMYLALVDKIGEISPEAAQLNRDGKRLLDISDAAAAAASRTSNHSLMGLGALGAGAGGYAHGGSPEAIASALAAAAAFKAAGQGRLSSVAIRTGQGIRKLGDILNPVEKGPSAGFVARPGVAGMGRIAPPPSPSPPESGFEGMGDLMTKKDFQASSKLGAESDVPDLNGVDLESMPDNMTAYHDKDLMDESAAAGFKPESGGSMDKSTAQAKLNMRRSLFGNSTKEIKMENLSPQKQVQINKMAERINNDPDEWNRLFDAGLLDKPHSQTGTAMEATIRDEKATEMISPDDIIGWVNEVTKKKDILDEMRRGK
jgi:hypothetical protein